MDPGHAICFETWLNLPSLECLMQRSYESATFSFADSASVHTYPVNPAYESATFWIRSPEWKFLDTPWIRNRVDAKSGYFFIRWCNKIEPSSLPWRTEQDANFARFTTHALLPIFPEESWVQECIRIRVTYVWTGKFDLNTDKCGREISESGKKTLRIQRYPQSEYVRTGPKSHYIKSRQLVYAGDLFDKGSFSSKNSFVFDQKKDILRTSTL